ADRRQQLLLAVVGGAQEHERQRGPVLHGGDLLPAVLELEVGVGAVLDEHAEARGGLLEPLELRVVEAHHVGELEAGLAAAPAQAQHGQAGEAREVVLAGAALEEGVAVAHELAGALEAAWSSPALMDS